MAGAPASRGVAGPGIRELDSLPASAGRGDVECDFITVDTVFFRRLYVLVFIESRSRIVHVAGITPHPTGEWVSQQARSVIGVLAERRDFGS